MWGAGMSGFDAGGVKRLTVLARGLALLALLCLAVPVQARPPNPGSEDAELMAPLHAWINAARTAGGLLCCSEADARPVEVRMAVDHWEVRFLHPAELPWPAPDGWQLVPPEAILRDGAGRPIPAPEGIAVAWWYGGSVRCFAEPVAD